MLHRVMNKTNRAYSLDALRGYAILTMVLSGTIAWGVLPGWMYHAQVGPRSNFQFDPSIYGITWVDLVFPFFLFAMGAAFPFSIGSKYNKGVSKRKIVGDSLLRAFRLTFFAIFIQHMYPHIVSSPQDVKAWILALIAFALMFPMFMRIPGNLSQRVRIGIQGMAYALAILILCTVTYANNREFSLSFSNIIILVLANMALFGSLIYLFTINKPWIRIAVLPLLMGVFLSSTVDGAWAKSVFDFTPIAWFYKFNFLKYLFIIIPGTIAGEYLYRWLETAEAGISVRESKQIPYILLISLSLILVNVYSLYMRYLVFNLITTVFLLGLLYWLLRHKSKNTDYWRKMCVAGGYLLVLGLFFESFEGGIRKDYATFSYYLVTSGLAFMAMIAFSILCDIYRVSFVTRPLVDAGQNPMIAYVAPQLLIIPILNLTGLYSYLELLNQNAWLGFLRGVIITSLAIGVTMIFTRLKWFWRT